MSAKLKTTSRKALESWLTENHFGVAHSRRQRDGSVRVYLFQKFGLGDATEVRWKPTFPWRLHLYAQKWVETNCGNLGGHQEDVYVGGVDLPPSVYEQLVKALYE